MSKEEFFKTVTKEQKEFIEFLCDEAWCKGYTEGNTDGRIIQGYEDGLW